MSSRNTHDLLIQEQQTTLHSKEEQKEEQRKATNQLGQALSDIEHLKMTIDVLLLKITTAEGDNDSNTLQMATSTQEISVLKNRLAVKQEENINTTKQLVDLKEIMLVNESMGHIHAAEHAVELQDIHKKGKEELVQVQEQHREEMMLLTESMEQVHLKDLQKLTGRSSPTYYTTPLYSTLTTVLLQKLMHTVWCG